MQDENLCGICKKVLFYEGFLTWKIYVESSLEERVVVVTRVSRCFFSKLTLFSLSFVKQYQDKVIVHTT